MGKKAGVNIEVRCPMCETWEDVKLAEEFSAEDTEFFHTCSGCGVTVNVLQETEWNYTD